MSAPIFEVVRAHAPSLALLGGASLRFSLFGVAVQGGALPYAVWQTVDGAPVNYLGDLPDVDSMELQVDAYADDPITVRAVGHALRDAIEPHAYITAWMGESQDPATKRWRFTFRVDWIVQR